MAAQSAGPEQAPSFASPQEEALLNLVRAADHIQRAMHHVFKPAGLTPTQYNVLRILRGARPAGLTCSAIGSRMITAEPDITRLLGRLKAQNLLSQQRDTHDRRVVWTHITEKGLDLLASLDQTVDLAPRELLKELTGAELKELTRVLKKIQGCPGQTGQATHIPLECPTTAKLPSPESPRRYPLE
jgi:DNA-binding MarR family transcriptional regulator